MTPRQRTLVGFGADLAVVALFVAIGRASHGEDDGAFLVTFWPFAVGLAAGWALVRAWRRPFAILRTGVPVWLATVAVGMVLRTLAGQEPQPTFLLVTGIVLGAMMIGWRLLIAAMGRSASRPRDLPGPVPLLPRRR